MKNHYQTLGIKRDTSTVDIKIAYRKLALKFHPDKNDGDKYFEERFKEIQEAYEILHDVNKKVRYDVNYDYFFSGNQKSQQTHTQKEKPKNESPKADFEKLRQEKEAKDKREREQAEKDRVSNIKKMFQNPFSFKGRIRRTEFGLTCIIFLIGYNIITSDVKLGGYTKIFDFAIIPLLWFLFAQGAKREHDLNSSGWWQIIPLRYFWLIFTKGHLGPNRFDKKTKNNL